MIPRDEWTKGKVDGEEEILLTASGVLILSSLAWTQDGLPKGREAMQRFCNYLARHEYKGTASSIYDDLMRMDTDQAVQWLRVTCREWVLDEKELFNIAFDGCWRLAGGECP